MSRILIKFQTAIISCFFTAFIFVIFSGQEKLTLIYSLFFLFVNLLGLWAIFELVLLVFFYKEETDNFFFGVCWDICFKFAILNLFFTLIIVFFGLHSLIFFSCPYNWILALFNNEEMVFALFIHPESEGTIFGFKFLGLNCWLEFNKKIII